jgi:hypothetical protein
MSFREQEPINREVKKVLILNREEIDAVENPPYINKDPLKEIPAIILLQDGTVREQFKGVVHPEQLK